MGEEIITATTSSLQQLYRFPQNHSRKNDEGNRSKKVEWSDKGPEQVFIGSQCDDLKLITEVEEEMRR